MYEVELKFPVQDPATVWARLTARGAVFGPESVQRDEYFAHPTRDFAATDEALRIRSVDAVNVLTYKGPVIDRLTKTRREVETPFAEGPEGLSGLRETLLALGFRSVRVVEKHRREATIEWDGALVTCTWDVVPPLGNFCELERLATEETRATVASAILNLAQSLDLGPSERRSYLEMLLERDPRPSA